MTLTLYTKPGCHLCEDVRTLLDELQEEYGYDITEVDISRDADLFLRYRYEIPVLWKDGKEVARGRITDRELLRAVRATSP